MPTASELTGTWANSTPSAQAPTLPSLPDRFKSLAALTETQWRVLADVLTNCDWRETYYIGHGTVAAEWLRELGTALGGKEQ